MKKQHIIWLVVLFIALGGIIIGSLKSSSDVENTVDKDSVIALEDNGLKITRADEDTLFSDGTEIQLMDTTITIEGSGATSDNSNVFINQAGDYLISGSLQNGRIIVNADADEVVHIFLNGVFFPASDGPAIYIQSAQKVIITLVDDQVNTLADGSTNNSYPTATACVYSEADLTFNGNGAFNIWSYYEDAIVSTGTIKILGGSFSISSIDDGIRGRDGVYIQDGSFYIQAEGTGIKSTHTTNESKGFVEVCGGSFQIISGEHAISAVQKIQVNNCNMAINTVLDAFSCQNVIDIEEGCINNGQ